MTPHSVLRIPPGALVVLVGASGSGKSTFARARFLPTEIVSSDALRGALADDESDQTVSAAAFEILHLLARRRLEGRRTVVVDATSPTAESRAPLLALARETGAPAIAVVFDVSLESCLRHNALRPGRRVEAAVVEAQHAAVSTALATLDGEGFERVYVLRGQTALVDAVVQRE